MVFYLDPTVSPIQVLRLEDRTAASLFWTSVCPMFSLGNSGCYPILACVHCPEEWQHRPRLRCSFMSPEHSTMPTYHNGCSQLVCNKLAHPYLSTLFSSRTQNIHSRFQCRQKSTCSQEHRVDSPSKSISTTSVPLNYRTPQSGLLSS